MHISDKDHPIWGDQGKQKIKKSVQIVTHKKVEEEKEVEFPFYFENHLGFYNGLEEMVYGKIMCSGDNKIVVTKITKKEKLFGFYEYEFSVGEYYDSAYFRGEFVSSEETYNRERDFAQAYINRIFFN